jgi:uncharacterized protein YcbK (DUF882 family)
MSVDQRDVGHRHILKQRVIRSLLSLTAVTCVSAALWLSAPASMATGESRTIAFYHVHTKENITVTYMKDGRYIPSAMKKINYLMRDWRRDSVVNIDPKTVDLIWELHEDLGSQRPVHIVCGFRSPKTNSFLKRIGRNVARHSQHMNGKAIDFYFPDVPTQKIRNSALVRKVGGVGYYRSSGGPTGFLHVDTGKVRHWGPRISKSQMAQIMREGERTLGKRARQGGSFAVASEQATATKKSGSFMGWLTGKNRQVAPDAAQVAAPPLPTATPEVTSEVNTVYAGLGDDLANLSKEAAVTPAKPRLKVVQEPPPQVGDEDEFDDGDIAELSATIAGEVKAERPEGVNDGYPVPIPRLKPIEIMMMAAANMNIEPASAEPDSLLVSAKRSPVKAPLKGVVKTDPVEQLIIEQAFAEQQTNAEGKGDFAAEIRDGVAVNVPVIRPVLIASAVDEVSWWPELLASSDALLRRNGAPPSLDDAAQGPLPVEARLDDVQQIADSKTNLQVIMRDGKGDLELPGVAVAEN